MDRTKISIGFFLVILILAALINFFPGDTQDFPVGATVLFVIFGLILSIIIFLIWPVLNFLFGGLIKRIARTVLVLFPLMIISVMLIEYLPLTLMVKEHLRDLLVLVISLGLFPLLMPEFKRIFFICYTCAVLLWFILYVEESGFLAYGLVLSVFFGYLIYLFSQNPIKTCRHCGSHKLSFESGKNSAFFWKFPNTDGSPDKRRKNNIELANFLSKWICKDCAKITRFKHANSSDPSKNDRIIKRYN